MLCTFQDPHVFDEIEDGLYFADFNVGDHKGNFFIGGG
jgi:hypothetical protein